MIACLRVAPLVFSWVGLFWLCRELAARKQIDSDWRLSWVLASVGCGALVTLVTEASSGWRSLTGPTLLITWSGICVVLLFLAARLSRARGWSLRPVMAGLGAVARSWARPVDVAALWLATTALVLLLGWIALVTPSTNADSLTYHLPRVMHWMQQQSVAHFPTANCRQYELGPWSAFVVAHLHLLQGGDRLANLVQWFAMLGSVVGAPLLARQLLRLRQGVAQVDALLTRRVGAFAALLVVTLPIGIVESVTPQTDYNTAFWLLCTVSLGLALIEQPDNHCYAVGLALATGLGVLTKATYVLYAAPLGLAFCWWLILRARKFRIAVACLLAVTALNGPHLRRNLSLIGSPVACAYFHSLEHNATISFSGTLSNLIRNAALHANTGVKPLTRISNHFLGLLHQLTGRDLNDPQTTYEEGPFEWREDFLIFDSHASCSLHLFLVLLAGGLSLVDFRQNRHLTGFVALFLASFILSCVLFRWNDWNSRRHLPYFVVLLPFASAVLLTRMRAGFHLLTGGVAAWVGFYCASHNLSRPILDSHFTRLSREEQYTATHAPELYAPLAQACEEIAASGCSTVALKLKYSDFEYPFWVLLRNRGFHGRLDHFWMDDVSGQIQRALPPPCVVLTTFEPPPATVTNAFPILQRYGVVTVCWPAAAHAERPGK